MTNNKDIRYPWWVVVIIEAIKSFGVTTVIVMVLLYVSVEIVIPEMMSIANRYCNAVETSQSVLSETQKRIVETQESMVSTQKELVKVVGEVSSAAQEIISVEQESQQFMQVVQEQHKEHLKKLDSIEKAVINVQ